ncbi:SDR family oxidoreductase [Bosea thiooxidans]|nr:SDR family oxidoreductase [Bosea sp. (in: a-proteobacteria)]
MHAARAGRAERRGRQVKPDEVAATVAFMLSEGTARMTGQQIVICGGALL